MLLENASGGRDARRSRARGAREASLASSLAILSAAEKGRAEGVAAEGVGVEGVEAAYLHLDQVERTSRKSSSAVPKSAKSGAKSQRLAAVSSMMVRDLSESLTSKTLRSALTVKGPVSPTSEADAPASTDGSLADNELSTDELSDSELLSSLGKPLERGDSLAMLAEAALQHAWMQAQSQQTPVNGASALATETRTTSAPAGSAGQGSSADAADSKDKVRSNSKIPFTGKMLSNPMRAFPKCAYCSERFKLRSLRDQHARQCKNNPHCCPQCGKACLGQVKLERHIRSHARSRVSVVKADGSSAKKKTDSPDPKCAYCNARYTSRVQRDRHSRICEKNPYRCAVCGKAFLGNAKLLRHCKTHEEEEQNGQNGTKKSAGLVDPSSSDSANHSRSVPPQAGVPIAVKREAASREQAMCAGLQSPTFGNLSVNDSAASSSMADGTATVPKPEAQSMLFPTLPTQTQTQIANEALQQQVKSMPLVNSLFSAEHMHPAMINVTYLPLPLAYPGNLSGYMSNDGLLPPTAPTTAALQGPGVGLNPWQPAPQASSLGMADIAALGHLGMQTPPMPVIPPHGVIDPQGMVNVDNRSSGTDTSVS